jgi:hypothetical protein
MLDRTTTDDQRRIRRRRATRECRDRQRRGRAVATVEYDANTLDLLIRHRYLTDRQATDKRLVGRAIAQLLRDVVEPPTPKNF